MGPATSFDEPPAAISEKLDLSLEELIQRNAPAATTATEVASERSRAYRPARFNTNRRDNNIRTPPHNDPNRLVSLRSAGPSSVIRKQQRRLAAPSPPETAPSHISTAYHQQRPPRTTTSGGGGVHQRLQPSDAALLATEVTRQDNGDVVVRLKQTDIIVVKGATGDLILNSGGYRTFLTKTVLNQALQPVGLWIDDEPSTAAPIVGDMEEAPPVEWQVSDGRSYLAAFVDGMVIRQAGALSKQQLLARGSVIMQFLLQRKTNAEKVTRSLPQRRHVQRRTRPRKAVLPPRPAVVQSANAEAVSQLDQILEQARSHTAE